MQNPHTLQVYSSSHNETNNFFVLGIESQMCDGDQAVNLSDKRCIAI